MAFQGPGHGGDGAGDARMAGLMAPVCLYADHLDDLAPSGGEFGNRCCLGVRDRPGFGPDALSEKGDALGIEPVGLGEPPGGSGEVADLARVDDCKR
jgi:hypothetical protein